MDPNLAPDPEEAAAAAFPRSAQLAFRDIQLLPYSFARQAARHRLGLQLEIDGAYLIFLCLTPDEEVTALWGPEINPWRARAEKWAADLGLTERDGPELSAMSREILRPVWESEFMVKPSSGPKPPKAPGQPAKPSSSAQSPRRRTAR